MIDNENKKLFPLFFIVGAPKCGTTTLYEWLREHPRVHAPRKEPGFFSRDIADNTHIDTHLKSLEEYVELLGTPVMSNKVGGEATPKYLYSDMALRDISRLNPSAKIIVCLRDPVDLVVSLYNQKLRECVETEATFENAWKVSLAALENGSSSLSHECHYYLWACLGSRLEKLHEYFPAENVLIILMKELRSDPAGIYRKVLSHIGIPDDGRSDFSSHNERMAVRSLRLHRVINRFKKFCRPILSPLYRIRGGKGFGLVKAINKFNMTPGQYTDGVSDQLRCEMYELLEHEIKLAERYLDGRTLVDQKKIAR